MNDWVIAEWIDDEGRVRAPSFQGTNGKWYRAGTSEYGGPTILMMDGEPIEITKIQGANPQRRADDHEMRSALRTIQVRQAAIGDSVANLHATVLSSLNRIERDLARALGQRNALTPTPYTPKLTDIVNDIWLSGAAMTQPVLAPQEPHKGPVPRVVYVGGVATPAIGGETDVAK